MKFYDDVISHKKIVWDRDGCEITEEKIKLSNGEEWFRTTDHTPKYVFSYKQFKTLEEINEYYVPQFVEFLGE